MIEKENLIKYREFLSKKRIPEKNIPFYEKWISLFLKDFEVKSINRSVAYTFFKRKEFVECPCDHYREFQWYTHDSIMQSYLYSIEEIILIRKLTGYTQVHPSEKHFSLQQPRKISIGRSRENDLCFLYGQCVHRKHGNFIVEKLICPVKANPDSYSSETRRLFYTSRACF